MTEFYNLKGYECLVVWSYDVYPLNLDLAGAIIAFTFKGRK